jgi:hypothetical protein
MGGAARPLALVVDDEELLGVCRGVPRRVRIQAIEAEDGDAGLHQLQDALNGGPGILGWNEVEVAVTGRRAEIGHQALIDAMGVDDDAAHGGLSEEPA